MDLDQTQAIIDKRYLTRISAPVIVAFILLGLFFLFLYRETVSYLLNDWTQWQNGAYAHGFAVMAVSIFMIWGLREKLRQAIIRPNLLATVLVFGFSLSWMIGILLGIRVVESMSFFLLIPSILIALTGFQFATRLWFPLAFLLVAFPVWELFLPYLQSLAATISYLLLKISGITVLKEDAYLIVPAGKFLVAEGCSGLRYLLAAMTFAGFFIYLERLTKWRAAIFFLIVMCFAILANVLRISTVVFVGNMTGMQHPWVHDHMMLGWYIFAGMLLPVFWIGNRFGDAEHKIKKEVTSRKVTFFDKKSTSYSLLIPTLLIALVAGPLLKNVLLSRANVALDNDYYLTVPEGQGGWKPLFDSDSARQMIQPVFTGADNIIDQDYSDSNNNHVRLFIASYRQQKQDKELINVNNYFFNEERWQATSRQVLSSSHSDQPLIELQLKSNSGEKRVIWYWYRTAGHITTRPVVTKLLDLYGMIIGKNSSSAIMLSVKQDGEIDRARNSLGSFYSAMINPINEKLDYENK